MASKGSPFERMVSKISGLIVRRSCLLFWGLLCLYLLIGVGGVAALVVRSQRNNQTTVFSDATDFDWSVAGEETVVNRDMVRVSAEQLAAFRESQADVNASEDFIQERSEAEAPTFTLQFYFYAKAPEESLFTAQALKEMCEIENIVLGHPDYGKVCFNESDPAVGATYTTDSATNCTLPRTSAVSLFYVQFDDSMPLISVIRMHYDALTTAMAAVAAAISTSSAWTAAKTDATNTINALVSPGGSFGSYDTLKAAAATAATNAAAGNAASFTTLKDALESLRDEVYAPYANLPDRTIEQMVILNGSPLLGIPTNAPLTSNALDDIIDPGTFKRHCQVLDADYVASRTQQIFEIAHMSIASKALVGAFIDNNAMNKNMTNSTRSVITFGAPRLAPYETPVQLLDWALGLEASLNEYFGLEIGCLFQASEFFCFRSPYRTEATTDTLKVKFVTVEWYNEEFGRLSDHDFIMVVLSVFFVWSYICFHTGSFALGCFAISQIILSVPVALFLYVVIFRIPYFAQVHNLAVFIILGVGADDLFVFMDAWRQSASMSSITTLKERMEYTYKRTVVTVLNTSLTTAIAFFATAAAPIMPIASFGVFAAIMIILNYVFCVSWWPAIVIVWELYFCRARCIGCCFSCEKCCKTRCYIQDATTHPATDPNAPRASVRRAVIAGAVASTTSAGIEALPAKGPTGEADDMKSMRLGVFETAFHDFYAPALMWHVRTRFFKPIALLSICTMASIGAYLTSEAVTLTTPDKTPIWFPHDHMWTGIYDEARDNFFAGDDDAYIAGNLYFGLKDMHAPDFSKWSPEKNRGTVIYDDSFDLSDAAAQAALLQICADLRVEPCDLPVEVCSRPPYGLTSLDSVECFLESFQAYSGGTLPTGAAFLPALSAWLDEDTAAGWRGDVGLIDGRLKYARVRFVYTALIGIPVRNVRILYDRCKRFLAEKVLPTAPATLGERLVFDSDRIFEWMVTSERLVLVVLQGFAIIFPCAFAILLFSTANLRAAIFATVTVALITGSLLGGVKVAFGFALGIGEAIAGCIVIGLSIDYTLHLSHAYMDSPAEKREDKFQQAVTLMGVTVVAGAMTTFCSALFMLPCQLTFFTDMCTLIGGTVMFSILFALFFFMPTMALIGPEGESIPLSHYLPFRKARKGV